MQYHGRVHDPQHAQKHKKQKSKNAKLLSEQVIPIWKFRNSISAASNLRSELRCPDLLEEGPFSFFLLLLLSSNCFRLLLLKKYTPRACSLYKQYVSNKL
jgi:hypothetical protein